MSLKQKTEGASRCSVQIENVKRHSIKMTMKAILHRLQRLWVRRSSESLIQYYRSKGVKIGKDCVFRSTKNTKIDLMRPSLITIGDNVDMNDHFTIMAHDFSHKVFLPLYGEFLSSSGTVSIGNNVYFGTNVTILKGGAVGDNCIIGAGSVVTKPIPSNTVAAGVPCKVICSIEEYYAKRQKMWIREAIVYANTIREREHREPTIDDFRPEFGMYVDKHNIKEYDIAPIQSRLKGLFGYWLEHHKAPFSGFNDFLEKSKLVQDVEIK